MNGIKLNVSIWNVSYYVRGTLFLNWNHTKIWTSL